MYRMIGIVLVLAGAGSVGVSKALQYVRAVRQLRQLRGALEYLKCEINYTMTPLPELCKGAAQRNRGSIGAFFAAYGEHLSAMGNATHAVARAMDETKGLLLPDDAKFALLELGGVLGSYDLEGENRILQLCAQRINAALERYEAEKRPLAKSYAVLGFCTGAALVIMAV